MEVELMARPGSAAARLTLARGEVATAEVGAMIAMSADIRVETTSRSRGGGMLQGIRRVFSGENFFLNHFTSGADGQELIVSPSLIGDMVHHRLDGGTLVVQGASWLASGEGVEIDTTWQGMATGLFGGEGLFWVKCSGRGDVLLNSFGGIYALDVDGGHVVDTGHVVAFEDTLELNIGKAASGWISSFTSGEGLVCKFSGRGKLYCQTHHPSNFGRMLGKRLKPREA